MDKNKNVTSSYYKQSNRDNDYNIKIYKNQQKDREDNNYNRSTYFKESKYDKSNEKINDNRQLNKTLSKESKSGKEQYKYNRKTYDKEEGNEANTIYNQYSKNSIEFNKKPQYETNKTIETKYTKIIFTKEAKDNIYRNKSRNPKLNEEKFNWRASDKKESTLINNEKGGIKDKYTKNKFTRYADNTTEENKIKKLGYSVQYDQGIKRGSKSYLNQSINNIYKYKESDTSITSKIPQTKSSYSFIKEKGYKDNIMTKNYSIDDNKDKNKNKYFNREIAYNLKEAYYKADYENGKREKERREKEEKEKEKEKEKERERMEKLRSQEKEKIRLKLIKEEKERIEKYEKERKERERLSKEKLALGKMIPKKVGEALRNKYYETERNEERQKSKENIYSDSKGNTSSKVFIKNIVIYPDPKSNMRNSNEAKDSLLTNVSSVNSINKFLVNSVEEESVSESSSRMSKRPTYKSKRYNAGQNKFKESDSTLSKSKVEETKYKKTYKSSLQSPKVVKKLDNINKTLNNDLSESQNNISIKEKYYKKEYQLTETPKRKFMFKFSKLEDPSAVHPKGGINNEKYFGDKKTKLHEKNIFIKSYDDFGNSLNDIDKYSPFKKTAKNKYENIVKNTGVGDGKTQKYCH